MVEIVIFNKIPRNSMRFLYYAKREVFFVRFPVRQHGAIFDRFLPARENLHT